MRVSLTSIHFRWGDFNGTAQPNLDSKRYNLQFSELIAEGGKHYPVAGFAVDESAQVLGVPGNYASGLGSRILGSVLSQAIEVGQDVGTARVLTNSGASDSVASMEMNRALVNTSKQATGDIGSEATADLRSAHAELSLPAGTVFTLKLKAVANTQGGAQ